MPNMKFAIRKLAMTCILPAALFQGALPTDVLAQTAPSAVAKANSGLPTRRTTPTRTTPATNAKSSGETTSPLSLARQPSKPRTSAAGSQPANHTLVRQVSSGGQQPRQTNGGETDVQRQLRMLYEKSGQEMPAMTLEDLEVPEPQPGVQPGGPGQEEGDGVVMQPRPQYAQPAVPPQKAPNFFERVFLGRKMPPPPPRQVPQRPQPYGAGQMRPGQPNGAMPPNGMRPNYQPYQPTAPGYPGQRPGMMSPQGTPSQPQGVVQQQLPPNSQVPPQLAPQLQLPQSAQQQPYVQQLPTPQPGNQPSTGGVVPPQNKLALPPAANDVPLLDEEPEESLDIDIKPQPAANSTAAPTVTPGNVIPPAAPDATSASPGENQPQPRAATDSAVEENPFSGLELSVPESAEPSVTTPSATSAAKPDLSAPGVATPSATTSSATTGASAAAKAILPANPTLSAPAAAKPSEEEDPFAAEPVAPAPKESVKPVAPAATSKGTATPAKPAAPVTANAPPQSPAGKQAATEPSVSKPGANDNLKKLSDASEKDGLKGFCPVVLRQKRQLIEAKPQFKATYAGKKYHFSSSEARATFEKSPQLFAPAHATQDAVALLDDDKSVPGTLDFAAWFQGRLYLFASQQNLEIFKADPEQYLDDEDSEDLSATLTGGTADNAKVAAPSAPAPGVQRPAPQASARPAPSATPKPVNTKAPPAFDDLPVLSENLDDLEPIAPPATSTLPVKAPAATSPNVPKMIGPAKESPVRETPIKETPKGQSPKAVTPKPVVPKALAPQGPKLGAKVAPIMQRASATVISLPPRSSTPPRPPRQISPDLLRIVPPTSAAPTR